MNGTLTTKDDLWKLQSFDSGVDPRANGAISVYCSIKKTAWSCATRVRSEDDSVVSLFDPPFNIDDNIYLK